MASVLIVEDDESQVKLLKATLGREYALQFARTGMKALETFGKEKFDLVITDFFLEDLDGMNLVREIRKVREIPFIVLSSSEDIGDIRDEFENCAWLVKPVTNEQLKAQILSLLEAS